MAQVITGFFGDACRFISDAFTASGKEDPYSTQAPIFDADMWKEHFGISVDDQPKIPEPLFEKLSKPSPFSDGKEYKDTHVLCLVPKGVTIDDVYMAFNSVALRPFIIGDKRSMSAESSYWILAAKSYDKDKADGTTFDQQKEALKEVEHEVPSLLEAIVVVACLHKSGHPATGHFSRCQEMSSDHPLAVVANPSTIFSVMDRDYMECPVTGTIGVLR